MGAGASRAEKVEAFRKYLDAYYPDENIKTDSLPLAYNQFRESAKESGDLRSFNNFIKEAIAANRREKKENKNEAARTAKNIYYSNPNARARLANTRRKAEEAREYRRALALAPYRGAKTVAGLTGLGARIAATKAWEGTRAVGRGVGAAGRATASGLGAAGRGVASGLGAAGRGVASGLGAARNAAARGLASLTRRNNTARAPRPSGAPRSGSVANTGSVARSLNSPPPVAQKSLMNRFKSMASGFGSLFKRTRKSNNSNNSNNNPRAPLVPRNSLINTDECSLLSYLDDNLITQLYDKSKSRNNKMKNLRNLGFKGNAFNKMSQILAKNNRLDLIRKLKVCRGKNVADEDPMPVKRGRAHKLFGNNSNNNSNNSNNSAPPSNVASPEDNTPDLLSFSPVAPVPLTNTDRGILASDALRAKENANARAKAERNANAARNNAKAAERVRRTYEAAPTTNAQKLDLNLRGIEVGPLPRRESSDVVPLLPPPGSPVVRSAANLAAANFEPPRVLTASNLPASGHVPEEHPELLPPASGYTPEEVKTAMAVNNAASAAHAELRADLGRRRAGNNNNNNNFVPGVGNRDNGPGGRVRTARAKAAAITLPLSSPAAPPAPASGIPPPGPRVRAIMAAIDRARKPRAGGTRSSKKRSTRRH